MRVRACRDGAHRRNVRRADAAANADDVAVAVAVAAAACRRPSATTTRTRFDVPRGVLPRWFELHLRVRVASLMPRA